ncbi:hypothetical protein SKAU_G00316710 [Synaphobranchus kaupii]|uniref:Calponin-homology (CH) domain-containing protein n=1 Tax=Synaphobranchus kaupii TaxID=118154 RepID=A0A9Q1ESU9_SYNKA|nr:hypothetical protein SKAU_G00316710 [Synaphobranchus kaupii]
MPALVRRRAEAPNRIPAATPRPGMALSAALRAPVRGHSQLYCEHYKTIYTDWANHYLAKSGHKRLIKDLQQDVTDGVLLAEIIQVIANEKIADINGCPKSRSQMIENIDACLSFLAAKGVNVQGLSAEEIRNGNLKAILGLFFSLSRYKQQQAQKHPLQTSVPCQAGTPPHGTAQTQSQVHTPSAHMQKAQAEMQSRLPGPSTRMAAAGSESKPRGSTSTGNRRSQSFNNIDKSKPAPAPASTQDKEPSEGDSTQTPGMTEHAQSPGPISTSSSAIPQPSSTSKPWRSKSLSIKHSATSSMLSVKQQDPPVEAPPKPTPAPQKSMLEKFKLFNSKGGSKSSGGGPPTGGVRDGPSLPGVKERAEAGSNTDPLEEMEGNTRPLNGTSSPKIALRGIAQRTFSRALTAKKSSPKVPEKDKPKDKDKAKEKDKDKAKEGSKRLSVNSEKGAEPREEPKEELVPIQETEPKKTSKIASFIPKGGKAGSAKKEGSAPAHSGIPKPGSKASGTGKGSTAPPPGKDGERPRSVRLGGGLALLKGQLDGRNSSSTSSLASEQASDAGATQTTASNTMSVQLPQPLQQYSHPNTATVAPFMYR